MKVITAVQGTVGLYASPDDVAPPNSVLLSDLVRVVGDAYNFSVRPPIQQGLLAGVMQQLVFQSGALEKGNDKLPILQLVILSAGEIVTAANTDIAEAAMDSYLALLDRELGYRFASSSTRRIYQSNIVVEFDSGIEDRVAAFGRIEGLLSREIKRADPFKIKRLAFGYGRVSFPMLPLSLQAIEKSDFVIERRDPEPYEKNRYFCGAPTITSELIRIIELVERELTDR